MKLYDEIVYCDKKYCIIELDYALEHVYCMPIKHRLFLLTAGVIKKVRLMKLYLLNQLFGMR